MKANLKYLKKEELEAVAGGGNTVVHLQYHGVDVTQTQAVKNFEAALAAGVNAGSGPNFTLAENIINGVNASNTGYSFYLTASGGTG